MNAPRNTLPRGAARVAFRDRLADDLFDEVRRMGRELRLEQAADPEDIDEFGWDFYQWFVAPLREAVELGIEITRDEMAELPARRTMPPIRFDAFMAALARHEEGNDG